MNDILENASSLLDKSNVITWVLLIYAAGGLIVVLAEPDTMNFNEYTTKLVAFAGVLGLGRGYASGKRAEGRGRAHAAAASRDRSSARGPGGQPD